jgi:hypothetical protein
MKKSHQSRMAIVAMLLFLAVPFTSVTLRADAQKKEPVIFKIPDGFFPGEFSNHLGKLMLNPKSPAGMFVGYPSKDQDMDGFKKEMQGVVAKMFLHDAGNTTWSSVDLPPHKGVDESGTLFSASNEKMEVQLAFYIRSEGVAYGYYGMRHKNGGGEDAKFLDAAGKGVKAFDELAKSISSK